MMRDGRDQSGRGTPWLFILVDNQLTIGALA